jgi:hypothetical protein
MEEQNLRTLINRDGTQYGPYTRDEAVRYLASGQLRYSDLARQDGSDSWLSLATILGISAPPPPPPVPLASSLSPIAVSAIPETSLTVHEELLRLFVGTNYEYYARKWRKAEQTNNPRSWNWAAWFGGFGWMAYRRMYRYCWIVIGIILVEEVFELAMGIPATLSNAVNLGILSIYGLYGNSWYKRHCEKKLKEIAPSGMAIEAARIEVVREGGTNIGAAIGFVVVSVILCILLIALGG